MMNGTSSDYWKLGGRALITAEKKHIPIVGHLTPWELIGFIAFILIAAFGAIGLATLLPFLSEINQPGSGGGAQMLLAIFVYPGLFVTGFLAIGGSVGFFALLHSARKRLHKRAEQTNAGNAT